MNDVDNRKGHVAMYRLAAIDIDGTLLTPERVVTDRTVQAVGAWQQQGNRVVLATARPFYRIEKYLRMLDLLNEGDYAIVFNGGQVVRADGAETIFSHSFSRSEVSELVDYGNSIGAPVFVYLEGKILSSEDNPLYREKNPDTNFTVVKDLKSENWDALAAYKIAYVGSPDVVRRMRMSLPSDLEIRYEVSSSVPQFVDFVPLGTSKAKALEMIGDRLGIAPREMVAFGDEDNDAPLLKFVGLGVAMGNASDDVKKIADRVCDSNANDGVAKFLEGLLGVK